MVPIPRAPVVVKVEVPVAPKAALFDVWMFVKKVVPVALVKVMFAKMFDPVNVLLV